MKIEVKLIKKEPYNPPDTRGMTICQASRHIVDSMYYFTVNGVKYNFIN